VPTAEDALAFVQGLTLAEVPSDLAALPALLAADTDPAYVDAGSVVSFVRGVSPQHKEDVLNSVLLAQLGASAKYNREKHIAKWYAYYQKIFGTVGWVAPAIPFSQDKSLGVEFTADKVILKLIEAIGTGNDVAILAAALEALKNLGKDDPAVKVFETQSHGQRVGNFQIGVAADSDDVIVVKLALAYFDTGENVTRLLWFRFKSSHTKFYSGSITMNLDDKIYARVRQAVIDKLGKDALALIKGLKT
jgi:hypothetical protein